MIDLSYFIPLINALFGWVIVDLLVSFVFRPFEKRNLLLFKVQGLIPSVQQSLAENLAVYISEQLVNFKELEGKLLSPENLSGIHQYLDEKAEDFLRVKLTEKLPVLSMFITDSLIKTAKETLVGELDKMIPEIVRMYSGKIQQEFEVKKKVKEFISNYPVQELEKKFYETAGNKILGIKIFIALLGALIGLFELGVLVLHF